VSRRRISLEAGILFSLATFVVAVCAALGLLAFSHLLPAEFGNRVDYKERDNSQRSLCDAHLSSLGYKNFPNEHAQKGYPKQYELDNLCGQIRSAIAAEDSAFYARWSLIFVVFATGFAGMAYWQARRQADAAWDAAQHSRRQMEIAELAYGNIDSPWVGFADVLITALTDDVEQGGFRANGFLAKIYWQNFGKSPAIVTGVIMAVKVTDTDSIGDVHLTTPELPRTITIPPGEKIHTEAVRFDSKAVLEEKSRVFFYSRIKYHSSRGAPYRFSEIYASARINGFLHEANGRRQPHFETRIESSRMEITNE